MKHILFKADIILFFAIVLAAALGIVFLSGSGQAQSAVIRVDGSVYQEVSLATDQTVRVGNVRIEVKDGAIAFVESDCPGQECVKAGWLKTPGATAACLPNRISITVSGESEVDAVAQ